MRETTLVRQGAGGAHPRRGRAAGRLGSVASRSTRPTTGCSRSNPTPRITRSRCFACGGTRSQPLIEAWDLDRTRRQIDRDLMPRSRALPGRHDRLHAAPVAESPHRSQRRRHPAAAATPQRRDEAIVIGAHYDHVGLGGRFSMTPERTGEIHNGADDNASGHRRRSSRSRGGGGAIARAFRARSSSSRSPARSAACSARRTTSMQPAVPLDDTVAMLNLDMVGRASGKRGRRAASKSRRRWKRTSRPRRRGCAASSVKREGPGAGRSDDSSFLDRRIPAINFFTGFHDDYHRPATTGSKIDAQGTSRVATLALELAARLAARARSARIRARAEAGDLTCDPRGHPRRRGADPVNAVYVGRRVRRGQRAPQPHPAARRRRQPARARGCCRCSNRRRRSTATSPPARSASRSRAWCSAPTRRRTFAVWLAPSSSSLGGLQDVAAQSTSAAVVLLVLTVGAGDLRASWCPSRWRCSTRRSRRSTRCSRWCRRCGSTGRSSSWLNGTRPAAAAAARRAAAGAPPHPLARRDRAADRREPRRRPARARRAPAAAARAAAEPAAGQAADGAAARRSRRSTSTRR